jgi:UDP-N-acetylmuramyl pentapeptide phosphotransferase/UDP-N-acetylglucosamine-1-phosphate transferase
MITNYLVWTLAGVCVGVTLVGVELMRRWSARRLLDLPNARSSHTRPTPRGGGLPLMVAAVGSWKILLLLTAALLWPRHLTLLIGTGMVLVVSWLDDLYTLRFKTRLLVQLAAALIVLLASPPPAAVLLPGIGAVPLGLFAWPLAVVWIAGMTNAYNFMDGIDGIAGVQGLIAGLAWVFLGSLVWAPLIGALGLYLAVGCAAFLCYNWAPARIFMGDVGSATLGFLFAALPFVAEAGFPVRPTPLWIAGAAVVWPFVFDTGFTLIRRWRRGENLTEAHRSHLYQRLVIAGWSHARVSLLYAWWATTTALTGFAMTRGLTWSGPAGLGWAAVSGFMVWRVVVAVETRAVGARP